jgi:hypothetical protein
MPQMQRRKSGNKTAELGTDWEQKEVEENSSIYSISTIPTPLSVPSVPSFPPTHRSRRDAPANIVAEGGRADAIHAPIPPCWELGTTPHE